MSRPRTILETFGRAHQGVWQAVEALRGRRAHEWPAQIFVPLDIAGLALVEAHRTGNRPLPVAAWKVVQPALELAGLAAWRMSQQFYRFDTDLYRALMANSVSGDLPGELLRRLPAWCVYIETPGLCAPCVGGGEAPVYGFFAWLDWRADRREDILTFALDTDLDLAVGHIPLVGTLEAGLASVVDEWNEGVAVGVAGGGVPEGFVEAAADACSRLLSLVLYLCAEDADYARPSWPTPRKTKRGPRLFPPARPTLLSVGERIGAALRKSRAAVVSHGGAGASGRASPCPHVRGAHWHTFWTGPLDGQRSRKVHWLPPILVGGADVDGLDVTVRPVRWAREGS